MEIPAGPGIMDPHAQSHTALAWGAGPQPYQHNQYTWAAQAISPTDPVYVDSHVQYQRFGYGALAPVTETADPACSP
jgi:hypothetical protein